MKISLGLLTKVGTHRRNIFVKLLLPTRPWETLKIILVIFFFSSCDIMPRNITAAVDGVRHMNLMPVYGLNVYSMLKHETLVLTLDAVNRIEKQLLGHLNRLREPEKKQLVL